MTARTVTDSAGRAWTCTAAPAAHGAAIMGRDLLLTCATPSVKEPLALTVGWQWESMAANGLARLISQASPVPRASM